MRRALASFVAAALVAPAITVAEADPADLSEAVYPPQAIPLRFSHRIHVRKVGLDCLACHGAVQTSVRTADRNLPPEAVCLGCHRAGEAPASTPGPAPPTGAARPPCATCHPGHETAGPPPAVVMPPAALKFGHGPHLARGIPCARCHAGVEDADLATRAHLPSMASCLGCHDGREAPARCATCHPSGPDGQLVIDLPGGRLVPTGRTGGADHRGDVARTHGPAAAADRDACLACHSEPECARCHAAGALPPEIHTADFLRTHPAAARRDDPPCGTCHRLQTFCVDCHLRSGLGTEPGRPGVFPGRDGRAATFHPPGWTDYQGGAPGAGHHAYEARRNLRVCVGCHEESTCIRCHSAGATARLRASPHPPGFRRHCGAARAANDRGCLKCHGTRAALDRVCD